MKLKVMTYNIRSGHPADRGNECYYDLSKTADVIAEFNPDFCGMNEVDNQQKRTNLENQAEKMASLLNYPHHYFAKAINLDKNTSVGGYGNALVSKFPILEAKTILPPAPPQDEELHYEQRAIAQMLIQLPDGQEITVLQTHFGLTVGERQNMLEVLFEIIDKTEGPLILMGDFNMRPNDWLLRPLRERLTELSEALGMRPPKTYPSCEKGHPDCKIDYVFVSKHFKPLSVTVKQTQASDHYPYYAEIELQDK